jgi:hypothetical protein
MDWRQYERQIYDLFRNKYPQYESLFDQKLLGRHSKILRQIDILVKFRVADVDGIGVFDCKCYGEKVDVQTIDYMIGFLDDLGARLGGVVTTKGFSEGAENRAKAASIDLRTIEFASVERLVDHFVPSLDFSDPRNSMYIPLLF